MSRRHWLGLFLALAIAAFTTLVFAGEAKAIDNYHLATEKNR